MFKKSNALMAMVKCGPWTWKAYEIYTVSYVYLAENGYFDLLAQICSLS
jgi:hypothetical protein